MLDSNGTVLSVTCSLDWESERLLVTYILLYLPDRNVSCKCTLCHWLFAFRSFYRCLVFVNSFNQSCHFLYLAFPYTGSFQMAIPFLLLVKLRLKTAQLSPGISWKILYLLRGIISLQRHETSPLWSTFYDMFRYHLETGTLCTVMVTWPGKS